MVITRPITRTEVNTRQNLEMTSKFALKVLEFGLCHHPIHIAQNDYSLNEGELPKEIIYCVSEV